MAEFVLCSQCGLQMERFEDVNGVEVDWERETAVCQVCRGVRGATRPGRKRDVLSGFGWKRGSDGKSKVPK